MQEEETLRNSITELNSAVSEALKSEVKVEVLVRASHEVEVHGEAPEVEPALPVHSSQRLEDLETAATAVNDAVAEAIRAGYDVVLRTDGQAVHADLTSTFMVAEKAEAEAAPPAPPPVPPSAPPTPAPPAPVTKEEPI